MILFICYFVPSILSLRYYEDEIKQRDWLYFLRLYAGLLLINVIATYVTIFFISIHKGSTTITNDTSVSFFLKYLIASTFYAFVIPPILNFLKRNIVFKISLKDNPNIDSE